MCWSLVMLCLQESVQDKINEATAAKSTPNDIGDVLSRINAVAQEMEDKNTLEGEVFKKVMATHESWVGPVLSDALAYSTSAVPRDKDYTARVLSGMHSPHKEPQENPVQTQLSLGFEENVWPALRSRGWKVDDKGKRKSYIYNGQKYPSIVSVLNAIPKIHPEITNMVNSLISSVKATCQEDSPTNPQVDMDSAKISSLQELKAFLGFFAPLQLLVDRNKANRIKLHHNTTVGRMNLVKALHVTVNAAEKDLPVDASEADRCVALSKMIKLNSKTSLPHPGKLLSRYPLLIECNHLPTHHSLRCFVLRMDTHPRCYLNQGSSKTWLDW
jgi:hypothetical protein